VTIASDRATAGTFIDLFDRTERDLAAIAERAAASHNRRGSPVQQIGDLYASFMDDKRVAELGWTPIRGELSRIAALQTASDFAREAGYLSSISGGGPFWTSLLVDADRPERLIVQISQGGLLLPSREYYLSDSPSMQTIRSQYQAYLTRIFTLVERSDASAEALRVLEVETAIARVQLSPIESRDAARAAGVVTLAQLPAAMPGFDWGAWARAQGIDRIDRISFAQAVFFKRFAALVPTLPLDRWKAYLSARHIFWSSPLVAVLDARFDCSIALNGQAGHARGGRSASAS
jgi:predicted metalloendopeptidase